MTTSTKSKTPIKKLSPRMLKAINLIMEGKMLQDIAQELEMSRQTISQWKNHHPLFKATLDALIAEVDEELRYTAPMKHAFVQSQLLKLTAEGPHESRLKAVQCYLDRFGPKDPGLAAASGLSETDALLLKVMQQRHGDQATGMAAKGEHTA